MRIVKVEATCSSCGHQWDTRVVTEPCPVCLTETVTGWTKELEDKVLAKIVRQAG